MIDGKTKPCNKILSLDFFEKLDQLHHWINTQNLKNRNKLYRLMKSQLTLQRPKAKMYLPTKAYNELDY